MDRKMQILVVDPDQAARTSVADLLRECGHPVAEARNASEALERAEESPPALVILDPWPVASVAASIVKRMRKRWPGAEVLVLTTMSGPHRRARSRFASGGHCLEKPCLPQQLLTEVDRLLSRAGSA